MSPAQAQTAQKFLAGFFAMGFVVVAVSWLITGDRPGSGAATTLLLLGIAWIAVRGQARAAGVDDAR